MGYSVSVTVPPSPGIKYGVSDGTARVLAAQEVERQQLPTACPECDSEWRVGSTAAIGSSGEDWTFTYRCPLGHQ